MVAKAKVRRGGELVVIPMEDVVAGNIGAIEAGDLVPADGQLLTRRDLEIDESALTGESSPSRSRPLPSLPTRRSATVSTWRS